MGFCRGVGRRENIRYPTKGGGKQRAYILEVGSIFLTPQELDPFFIFYILNTIQNLKPSIKWVKLVLYTVQAFERFLNNGWRR